MEETGRIQKIEGKKITVQGNEVAGCFGCMNQECRTNGHVYTAENTGNIQVAVGDLVEIRVSAVAAASSAVVVLLPPLVGFVLAYVLVAWAAPMSTDAARAAAGVGGLLAGFLGVYWVSRSSPPKAGPEVVRVMPKRGTMDEDGGITAEEEPVDDA
jgi:positive regulator of sigma E activity